MLTNYNSSGNKGVPEHAAPFNVTQVKTVKYETSNHRKTQSMNNDALNLQIP